jgi:hypothetical protein
LPRLLQILTFFPDPDQTFQTMHTNFEPTFCNLKSLLKNGLSNLHHLRVEKLTYMYFYAQHNNLSTIKRLQIYAFMQLRIRIRKLGPESTVSGSATPAAKGWIGLWSATEKIKLYAICHTDWIGPLVVSPLKEPLEKMREVQVRLHFSGEPNMKSYFMSEKLFFCLLKKAMTKIIRKKFNTSAVIIWGPT